MLAKLTCLNCGHVGLQAGQPDGHPACSDCGAVFDDGQVVCPECTTLNAVGRGYCGNCDAALARACAHCGTQNWVGLAECANCGEPLDVVNQVLGRQTAKFGDTLSEQRLRAASIKEQGEASSRERMAALREQEERYMQRIAAAKARRDAERRQIARAIIVAAAGIAILFAVAIVVYLVVSS